MYVCMYMYVCFLIPLTAFMEGISEAKWFNLLNKASTTMVVKMEAEELKLLVDQCRGGE